jgi:hypothetical protein
MKTGRRLWRKMVRTVRERLFTRDLNAYSANEASSSPAATSPTNGVIDVYARGNNAALYEWTYS